MIPLMRVNICILIARELFFAKTTDFKRSGKFQHDHAYYAILEGD
jgi:hypothetical protein